MADAVYQSPALLVFVHIPKTAGTTLRAILNMNEPGSHNRALGNVFKGGGGLSKAPVERLRNGRGPSLKEAVTIVRGHFPLGIREYLPKERELRCFTFLREPADRTLSHFFAIRDVGGAYRLPPLSPEATLDDALQGGYVHDNLHTRMLSGDPEPFGEVTEEMLEQAKRNLRTGLVVFGLTERFDESLVLAKRRLGLRAILYRLSARVNPTRPRGDQIPAELRRAAERCNRYDIELYRYATGLFEEAPERGELEFEVELAALRAAKSDGEPEVEGPPPPGFGGDQEAWDLLIRARAASQRLEWDRARHRIPHISATVQDEALENELKAVRSKASSLEREVERLNEGSELKGLRSRVRRLEREIEDLRGARSRARRLEQQVARLTAASSNAAELEQEVKRLTAASAKVEKLQQQVERLTDMRARNKELQAEVQRLNAASSRATELEREVARLQAASSRKSRELQHKTERLEATQSRKQKLEEKVERLRADKEIVSRTPSRTDR